MRVTRQTIYILLAVALLAASNALDTPLLLGQEPLEFEVLTGREISGNESRSYVSSSSPGDQFAGMSVRRRRRVRSRPVSHPNVTQPEVTRSYAPRHMRFAGGRKVGDTTVIESAPGNTVYEEVGGVMPVPEPCHDGSCGPVGCDSCGGHGCYNCIPCPKFSLKNMQFIVGAQGFLSPRDMNTADIGARAQGQVANPHESFGFHGGVNWGFHFPCVTPEIAFQLGALFVGSNYNGELSTFDKRNQTFITGGVYRRVDWGLQGGLVLDYVDDDWYVDHQLLQIRGEVSWVFQNCFEFGFNFASATNTSQSIAQYGAALPGVPFSETRKALDYYRFFIRQRFQRGGVGRLFAGWTEDGDGLVGADFTAPISCDWAVRGGFTYVSPQNDLVHIPNANANYDNELWNVSVSLVWFPGGFDNVYCKYNRPLFNVADNGTLLQKIQR